MSGARRFDRRAFIRVTGGLAAAGAIASTRPWRAILETLPTSAAERLAGVLGDSPSAIRVGAAYMAEHRVGSAEEVASRLIARLPDGSASSSSPASSIGLREVLATRIGADYREARCVEIDGWVVSSAEADLCALAALRPREPVRARRVRSSRTTSTLRGSRGPRRAPPP